MKIPEFYESRWNKIGEAGIKCKDSDDSEYLDYIRKEYEFWVLWIDRFYNGDHGIFKIGGDAPRYVLEDHLDFCIWDKYYKKNYKRRDHLSNHRERSGYIINLLRDLWKQVERKPRKFDPPRFIFDKLSLKEMREKNLEEMKEQMSEFADLSWEEKPSLEKMDISGYKERWFKAAHYANDYITTLCTRRFKKSKKSKSIKSIKKSIKSKKSKKSKTENKVEGKKS